MASRAGNIFLSTKGHKGRACRLFEEEDLRPEERAYVSLLNLGLMKSLQTSSCRSLLSVLPRAGRRDDPTQRDVRGEEEGHSPEDLLS